MILSGGINLNETADYIVYTGHNISTTIGSERVRNRYLRKKRT